MGLRRIEVITGVSGRRPWSPEVKAQIVAESFKAGAVVAEVARRHGMKPQQLHGWRRLAREGRLVMPMDDLAFAPIVASLEGPAARAAALAPARAATIEIEIAGAAVRIGAEISLDALVAVFTALRRSA